MSIAEIELLINAADYFCLSASATFSHLMCGMYGVKSLQ
jgi:hypothetical protein